MLTPIIEKYYYLNNDIVFKLFFKKNIKMLKRLISISIGMDENNITNVNFIDPVMLGTVKIDKTSVLDLLIELESNEKINIEMQNTDNENMLERMEVYISQMIIGNIKKGDDYSKIKKVYGIYLLNYDDKDYEKLFSKVVDYDIMNKKRTRSMREKIVYNLTKINEIDNYEFSEEQKDLLKFIKCNDRKELEKMAKKNIDLQEALEILDEINSNPGLRLSIAREQIRQMDEAQARNDKIRIEKKMKETLQEMNNVIEEMNTAIEQKNTAIEEKNTAIEEKNTAIDEKNTAIEEKNNALKEKDSAVRNIVKNLLSLNMKPDDISKATGLSIDTISNIS